MADKLREELQKEVVAFLDTTSCIEDETVYQAIDQVILEKAKKQYFSLQYMQNLRKELFNSIRRLDVLQELLDRDDITEIMINGYQTIFVEKGGKIFQWEEGFSSKEKYFDVIQQIVSGANRIVNEASPIVDARLSDGSRVNVVLDPISLDGSAVTIRKFPKEILNMEALIQKESLSVQMAAMLKLLVRSGYNIFISGGTGSGKTTFLNALSGYIESDKRVITIEDSAELRLIGMSNLIRLESRNANMEGGHQITIRDLLKASLRMRPDFIVIGEVRGEEAVDMLQALNTGHSGFSTGHANHCIDMLSRLETMVLMGMEMPLPAVQAQIASAIDILVHLGRLRDRTRRVLEVAEVAGCKDGKILLNPLFQFVEEGEYNGKIIGKWELCGTLKDTEKLKLAGYLKLYLQLEHGETYEKVLSE